MELYLHFPIRLQSLMSNKFRGNFTLSELYYSVIVNKFLICLKILCELSCLSTSSDRNSGFIHFPKTEKLSQNSSLHRAKCIRAGRLVPGICAPLLSRMVENEFGKLWKGAIFLVISNYFYQD
jgi:hypothetical protein